MLVGEEGQPINPDSIISLPFRGRRPVFPSVKKSLADQFLLQLHKPKKKWAVITDENDVPRVAMDVDGFLRDALLDAEVPDPCDYSHFPIVVSDPSTPLGDVLRNLPLSRGTKTDVVERDIILVWGKKRRIVTGADILARLLRGIARRTEQW